MIQCSTCATHRRSESEPCPWCGGSTVTLPLKSAVAFLLGLTLTGCPAPQPKYGTTPTDDVTQTGDTADDTQQ